ncbi:hypothetical protein PsorP6_006240 [Peronosclerospora sorghi]|uniref:Uncharacterized protein n=1 Tax=Peronosclerospora sorghi TaxID=230839 RepID=A0ACC0W513_9STRA|nr:hypothetical protein PsorP6_006240 [Peronosclerospora sorghi]
MVPSGNFAQHEGNEEPNLKIGVSGTKLNTYDYLQSNEHFIYSADCGARCFWSHTTSPLLDERREVALLLSSSSPLGEVKDLTANVYTEQVRNRYLLLKTCLGDQAVFIHVSLPVTFEQTGSDRLSQDDDSFHIVLGDLNVTLDSFLDQATPYHHIPGHGRPVLRDWLDALRLIFIDAWHFQHPDLREFTSPTRKNRLDYCFLTVPLIRDHLAAINHVRDREGRCEDHTPVEFILTPKLSLY